jgi:hypothetical protein
VVDVDAIPSLITGAVIPTMVEEQDLTTKEMDVDLRGEEQNPTQKIGLGAPPNMDENDDEHKVLDDPRGLIEATQQPVA